MDSMTKDELDCVKPLDEKRIKRIARGAGVHPAEIHFLLQEHKKFSGMVKQVGSLQNLAGGNMDAMKRNPQAAMKEMQKSIDPKLMQSMGGMGNIMNMAK